MARREFRLIVETPNDPKLSDMLDAGGKLYSALESAGFVLLQAEEVEIVEEIYCRSCKKFNSGVRMFRDGKFICFSCMGPVVKMTRLEIKAEPPKLHRCPYCWVPSIGPCRCGYVDGKLVRDSTKIGG